MSQLDDYETLNQMLVRMGVEKFLNSAGRSTRKEIKKMLAKYSLDINICYSRPDVLSRILKMIYGRSYVNMIDSI